MNFESSCQVMNEKLGGKATKVLFSLKNRNYYINWISNINFSKDKVDIDQL